MGPGWAIWNNPLQGAILKPASAYKNSKRISNQAFFRATSNKSYYWTQRYQQYFYTKKYFDTKKNWELFCIIAFFGGIYFLKKVLNHYSGTEIKHFVNFLHNFLCISLVNPLYTTDNRNLGCLGIKSKWPFAKNL